MKITRVTVRKEEKEESRLKGYAIIEIDSMFVVRDIRIIKGDNGLFIAMPSRKANDGKFKDICHPISQECRDLLTEVILEEYNK